MNNFSISKKWLLVIFISSITLVLTTPTVVAHTHDIAENNKAADQKLLDKTRNGYLFTFTGNNDADPQRMELTNFVKNHGGTHAVDGAYNDIKRDKGTDELRHSFPKNCDGVGITYDCTWRTVTDRMKNVLHPTNADGTPWSLRENNKVSIVTGYSLGGATAAFVTSKTGDRDFNDDVDFNLVWLIDPVAQQSRRAGIEKDCSIIHNLINVPCESTAPDRIFNTNVKMLHGLYQTDAAYPTGPWFTRDLKINKISISDDGTTTVTEKVSGEEFSTRTPANAAQFNNPPPSVTGAKVGGIDTVKLYHYECDIDRKRFETDKLKGYYTDLHGDSIDIEGDKGRIDAWFNKYTDIDIHTRVTTTALQSGPLAHIPVIPGNTGFTNYALDKVYVVTNREQADNERFGAYLSSVYVKDFRFTFLHTDGFTKRWASFPTPYFDCHSSIAGSSGSQRFQNAIIEDLKSMNKVPVLEIRDTGGNLVPTGAIIEVNEGDPISVTVSATDTPGFSEKRKYMNLDFRINPQDDRGEAPFTDFTETNFGDGIKASFELSIGNFDGSKDGTLIENLFQVEDNRFPCNNACTGDGNTALGSVGAYARQEAIFLVTNSPPTPVIKGPSETSVRINEFTFSAMDVPGDQSAGFKYEIDWGDGTSESITDLTLGDVVLTHSYNSIDTFTISVTAEDKDGGVSTPVTHTLTFPDLDNDSIPDGIDSDLTTAGEFGDVPCVIGTFDPNSQTCLGEFLPNCPFETEFNSVTNLCEALSTDCPADTILNEDTGLCEADPTCPVGSVFNFLTSLCDTSLLECPDNTVLNEDTGLCEAEVADCPDGSAFNPSTSLCEVTPTGCPADTFLIVDTGICEAVPSCPAGSTLNSQTSSCEEIPICPAGTIFNLDIQICESSSSCPVDLIFNPDTELCEADLVDCPVGSVLNSVTDLCEAVPSCPVGTNLSPISFECSAQTTSCPSGTIFNPQNILCEQEPTCPADTIYERESNSCYTVATGCPAGTTLNIATNLCEAIVCPAGSELNSDTNQCESIVCLEGTVFSSATNTCVQIADTCPAGTSFNSDTNLCEVPSTDCPAGSILNSVTNLCEAESADCPLGTVFNSDTNLCEAEPTECPSGTSFNSGTSLCEGGFSCSEGFDFNSETNLCEEDFDDLTPKSLVRNGSFESGPDPGLFVTLESGDSNIGPWEISSGGSVDHIQNLWVASHGFRSLDMSGKFGTFPNTISQSFTTTNGDDYKIIFDAAANPGCTERNMGLNVELDGNLIQHLIYSNVGRTAANMGWTPALFSFTATSNISTLSFTGTDSSGCGVTLDNVSVVPSVLTCPDDSILNADTNFCEVSVTCPAGSSYNSVTSLCEGIPTGCPFGANYNPANALCESPVSNSQSSPGTSSGQLVDSGDQDISIFEEPNPDGIFFNAKTLPTNDADSIPATIIACNQAGQVQVDSGDSGKITCGSITVSIVTGSVDVQFNTSGGPATTTMGPADSLTFDGTLTFTNNSLTPAVITIGGRTITLGPGETLTVTFPGTSTSYQDPNLGDVIHGEGHDNGFCMNQNCIDVDGYFNHFPETIVPQGSTQTFSLLIHCPRGVDTCNHATIEGVLPDSDYYDEQWGVTLERLPRSDTWETTINNKYGEIGEVTTTVQEVGQTFLSVSYNIEFLIPGSIGTHDGIGIPHENNRHLHVTVWDSNRGISNYIFNEGVYVDDIFSYPQVETSYESPIELEPLCLDENTNKRYTCAFDKVRDWTIQNAEKALLEIEGKTELDVLNERFLVKFKELKQAIADEDSDKISELQDVLAEFSLKIYSLKE